jgi:dTDP-4-dehydrorhamnose reductase
MKTVVLGGVGFIGRHFLSKYRVFYPDTIGTSSRPLSSHLFFDLKKPDIAPLQLREHGYTWALIACGMTGIAQCERDAAMAHRINVEGTLETVRQLIDEGITPIFISSDYVFDGAKGGYSTGDPRQPLNVYGRLKAEAEENIIARCNNRCLIVRLSKIYGLYRGDGTLIDAMAQVLQRGDTLQAAIDQIFCPTFIEDVVEGVVSAQTAHVTGLINLCAPETWSRFDVACVLADALGIHKEKIAPIALDDLRESFKRPKNTSMQATRLALPKTFMSIREAIGEYVARMTRQ